jgi:hypothetical protein
MNARTLKALRGSIAHWKRMATGKARSDEKPYADYCDLCTLFLKGDCSGCPVMERTGKYSCLETPYYAAHGAYISYGKHSRKFKAAAKKELTFLRSLLPKRKRTGKKKVGG